jgi:N-acetylglucosamine kinase-like BadF-type ATPase
VATLDGTVVGRGTAGGANKNSSGGRLAGGLRGPQGEASPAGLAGGLRGPQGEASPAGLAGGLRGPQGEASRAGLADVLGAAMETALSTVDRAAVRLGVLGGAGSAGAGREVFRAAAIEAWHRAGLAGEVVTVTDLEVAFAAGTATPDGVLLLAGTGAAAVRFAGGAPERRCDGYGWLLGDEGSAVWIGVRALRAVLAALDGRGEPTALLHDACELLGVECPAGAADALSYADREDIAQAVLAAALARPPAALGRLAPAVSAAADAEDPVARRISASAAARLLHTLDTVGPPAGGVVVLAGSVLLSPGPVARVVRAGVAERTGAAPREAVDGAGGAAAMALARLTGAPVPATVHSRLTRGRHESSRE